ncbi:MAG: TIGR01906 family membrane protein [Ardenticatenaceae bacterium]|nr:TIGR01906 family membrane protein [Ardenticatenaceae bacterium]
MITFAKFFKWLMVLAMPFMLGFGTIRAVINWDYPSFEYARIPPDAYGWTPEERLANAHVTLAYLQRPEPAEEVIFMIEELTLPEDPAQPLYNEREIGHMLDVKIVADQLRNIFWVLGVLIIITLLFLLSMSELRPLAADLLRQGGWATIIALVGIGAFIGLAWQYFFVLFHELLFPPGTWTFYYTDSLIRLFPEQFWFDVGVLIVAATLLQGVILVVIGRIFKNAFSN